MLSILISLVLLQCTGPLDPVDEASTSDSSETITAQDNTELNHPKQKGRDVEEAMEESPGNEMKDDEKMNKSQEMPQEKKLEMKGAKITYQYSGNWEGTEVVYFDQYGKRVVNEQNIIYSEGNQKKERVTWNGQFGLVCKYKSLGDVIYSCEKVDDRPLGTKLSALGSADEEQLEVNYTKIGTKKILGKEAQGWQGDSETELTVWRWKGIDLKIKNQGAIKEAVSYEEIDAIPSDKISAPPGFNID